MTVKLEKPARKTLYPFQKQAVKALLNGKHFIVSTMGSGKSSISIVWAYFMCQKTKKNKILVITTSSKTHTKNELGRNDFEQEMWDFLPEGFCRSTTLEVVSWDSLYKWVNNHKEDFKDWVIIADEVAKMSGWTTRRGKSFLALALRNPDWAGFTGTPGDTWEKFGAYFHACGLVKNKTAFKGRFCIIQTYKGFPETVGYREEHILKRWWADISYAPDTSQVTKELPAESHRTIRFKCPPIYNKVLKTREYEGEFIDTPSNRSFRYV